MAVLNDNTFSFNSFVQAVLEDHSLNEVSKGASFFGFDVSSKSLSYKVSSKFSKNSAKKTFEIDAYKAIQRESERHVAEYLDEIIDKLKKQNATSLSGGQKSLVAYFECIHMSFVDKQITKQDLVRAEVLGVMYGFISDLINTSNTIVVNGKAVYLSEVTLRVLRNNVEDSINAITSLNTLKYFSEFNANYFDLFSLRLPGLLVIQDYTEDVREIFSKPEATGILVKMLPAVLRAFQQNYFVVRNIRADLYECPFTILLGQIRKTVEEDTVYFRQLKTSKNFKKPYTQHVCKASALKVAQKAKTQELATGVSSYQQ